jgi:hypothetical protein
VNIEESLYKHLSTYAGLTALVSTRIYPIIAPQSGTLPAVTLQSISTDRVHAFQQDTGFAGKMIQVSSWGDTYSSVKSVSNQVRFALQDYSGVMGGLGGAAVNAVLIENEMDDYDSLTKTYVVHQEYEIWYQEV